MAIQISPDGRTFTLQTAKSSYQMMADAYGVLLHLYYGRKIAAENLEHYRKQEPLRNVVDFSTGYKK